MSNDASAPTPPPTPTSEAARALRDEARFGAAFLRRHGLRLLVLFGLIGLSLWGFAELADEVGEGEPFPFDDPLLLFAHDMARAGFDRFFLLASRLGYEGVIVADTLLVLALLFRHRLRASLFAATAFLGSMLLNVATKHFFERIRPALWDSIAPETTYSFPSGHAMGSITLAWVAILLLRHLDTPHARILRPLVVALATTFVLSVGLSRIYLGVHYPSDILAGWAAATAWTLASYGLIYPRGRPFSPPSGEKVARRAG